MTSTRIVIKDDRQFERLEAVRERHGVNWRGMLIQGAKRLEGRELRFALTPDDPDRERHQSEPDVTDRGEQPVKSPTDTETHETPANPDTSTTDHRLDSRLFDANGTLRTVESEINHGDGGAVEFTAERAER